MGSAVGLGLGLAALSAGSSILNSGYSRLEKNRQASQQAAIAENEAKIAREQGRIEAYEIDKRKSELRREYDEARAANNVALGAGNVDLSSGSAARVATGNINKFSADIEDNAYARALKLWEANESANQKEWEAEQNRNSLSRSTALPDLLGATISGIGGFAQGYSWGGGKFSDLFKWGKEKEGLSAISKGASNITGKWKNPIEF